MAGRATVIPSIFTAIDRVSSVMSKMTRGVNDFASKSEAALARSDRAFRRIAPGLNDAGKEMLSFVGTAAVVGATFAGINYSVDSLKKYEDAVASFRTIVSDATDTEFAAYEAKIGDVANATRRSTIEVAQSFERIAGLNAEFAKTADGLGEVSKASITLAKASRMELEPATDSLIGIMNQFSLKADQADRTINVLAAGQAVGAASIQQTSEAFVNFGSVAAGANITLEESVALVQTLGKFSLFGAEAGTKLRGAVIKLQQANVGYASGQFNINDALVEAKGRIDKLRTAKEKDAAITKMFGLENVNAGRILLNNIDLYKGFVTGVTGTSEAQKAAAINSGTLSTKIEELKARWVNLITTTDTSKKSLNAVKSAIGFVSENMETILAVGGAVLGFFVAWKAALVIGSVVIGAYNIALGVMGAVTGVTSIAVGKSTIALTAYKVVTAAVTAATYLWSGAQTILNLILTLNPIGIVIMAIAALIAIIIIIATKTKGWGEQWQEVMRYMTAFFDLFKNSVLVGLYSVEMGFMTVVDSIVSAWQWAMNKIGVMSDEEYAKAKKLRESEATARMAKIQDATQKANLAAAEISKGIDWKVSMNKDEATAAEKPVASTKVATAKAQAQNSTMTQTNNASLNLNINDPNNRTKVQGSVPSFVTVNTSTTRQ